MIDLADVLAHTFATPAPTAAGPGDPPQMPTGPWHPRHADEATYRAWLNSLDTDEFIAEIGRGGAEVEQVTGRRIWRAA